MDDTGRQYVPFFQRKKQCLSKLIISSLLAFGCSVQATQAQLSSPLTESKREPIVDDNPSLLTRSYGVEVTGHAEELNWRLRRSPVKKPAKALKERQEFYERPLRTDKASEFTKLDQLLGQAGLSTSNRDAIYKAGVKSLTELRSIVGQKALLNLNEAERKKAVAASRLSILSSDPKIVSSLIRHEISLKDLEKLSSEEVVKKSGGEVSIDSLKPIKNKAAILHSIIELQARTGRVLERNPPSLYSGNRLGSQQFISAVDEAGTIEACSSHDNVFSPSTYLIHILDFITKWLEIEISELDLSILMQRIEDLPVALNAGDEVRYVTLTNRILENVIARWWGQQPTTLQSLPNTNISWGWKDLHLPLTQESKNEMRIAIYDEFKSDAYENEPGFDSAVLVKLFESYVREFGTTRSEVRFASGSETLKVRFKEKHGFTDSDLEAMILTNENIDLAGVEKLTEQLFEMYVRLSDKTIRREYIDMYSEELREEFIPVFRATRDEEFKDILEKHLDAIPSDTEGEDFDAVLLNARNDSATCVDTGLQCPEGHSVILPVKELFRHFSPLYPDYNSSLTPEQFSNTKLESLIAELKAQRFEELLEEHGNGGLPAEKLQELEAQAEVDAVEAVTSESVFDQQVYRVGEFKLDREIQAEGNEHRIFDDRDRRAEDKWRKAVSRAEMPYLAAIRKNLIIIALYKIINAHPNSQHFSFNSINGEDIAYHNQNFERLQDILLLDLTATESKRTTALAFSISRLHTLVHALMIGKPDRVGMSDSLRRTWDWAGSYGTWHASKMVTAYPENFLIPEIRRDRTDEFLATVAPLEEVIPEDLSEVFSSYHERISELVDMEIDAAVPVSEQLFLFAHNDDSIKYSVLSPSGRWTGWRSIRGLEPHRLIVTPSGATIPDPDKEHYRVFVRRAGNTGPFTIYLFRKISSPITDEQREELNTTHPLMATWYYASFKPNGNKLENLSAGMGDGDNSDTEELNATWIEIEDSGNPVRRPQRTNHLYLAKTDDGVSLRFPFWRSDLGETIEHQVDLAFENDGTPYYDARRHERTGFITLARAASDPTGEAIVWHQIGGHYACSSSDGSECGGRVQHPDGPDDALYFEDWRTGQKEYIWWMYSGKKGFSAARADNGDALISYYTPSADSNGISIFRVRPANGGIQIIPGGGAYAQVPSTTLYDRIATLSGRTFVFGHQILEDYGGDPHPGKEIVYVKADLLETEPLRLSFHSASPTGAGKLPLSPYYYQQLSKPEDPIRVYLDEYLLHLPMWIAEFLNRDNRYSETIKALQRVADDPLDPTCALYSSVCFPGFAEVTLEAPALAAWLVDPFNPYALSNLDKRRYKAAWLTAYVRNLIDWADRLFTMDSPETVNLAREKYEYAAAILGLPYWAIQDEQDSETPAPTTIGDLSAELDSADSGLLDQIVLFGMTPEIVDALGEVVIQEEIPDLAPRCLPANPLLATLQWHIEANLRKISRNQNIAGLERDLQLYATPVDPTKLVRQAAAGQLDFEEAVPSTPPPIFRFSFLVERAESLVEVAQRLENSMLIAIQQAEEAEYNVLRARQDLGIQRENVVLHQLRVQEANDHVRLAEAQRDRAEFSHGHYLNLYGAGMNSYEALALINLGLSIMFPSSITVTAGVPPSASVSYSPSGILQTLSSMASMQASFARRKEEWLYQANLAGFDMDAAQIGIDMANSHVEVTAQEEAQARLSYGFAKDNVEFLTTRFGNAELYSWMGRQLRRLYRTQLNMAYATARAAQKALEFERQTSLDFIKFEYWDEPREGLLAAERLLSDISKLEQFRVSSAQRKKEIETTFSLAFYAPEELQRLRETGVMEFRTLKSWFDRQFPGHYLRMIKNVSITTLALVPPTEGIHATLSNPGISYVMVGEPFDRSSIIYRLPDSVALSSAGEATGLFELRLDDPMLLPFEGSGVDTSWRFEMPKGANRFDYTTIADILFTIRYTAIESRAYREKLLLEMGMDESGRVEIESRKGLSLRYNFPDQWYQFFNPVADTELTGRNIEIELNANQFPHNEFHRKIGRVTMMLQWRDVALEQESVSIPVLLEFAPSMGSEVSDLLQVNLDQTITSTDQMRGKAPYGRWKLTFQVANSSPVDADWLKDNLRDVLVVFDYKAKVHYTR